MRQIVPMPMVCCLLPRAVVCTAGVMTCAPVYCSSLRGVVRYSTMLFSPWCCSCTLSHAAPTVTPQWVVPA
jgi:hypothetical protein